MIDSIYHMRFKLLINPIFGLKHQDFAMFYIQGYNQPHYITLLNCKPFVGYGFYCMATYQSQMRRHAINNMYSIFVKMLNI